MPSPLRMSTSAQNGQNALRSVRSHRSQIDDADRAVLMDTLVSDGIRSRESVWDPGTAGYSCKGAVSSLSVFFFFGTCIC